jgi:plasmid stabilization system protein ParE
MRGYRILRSANRSLDEIAEYTTEKWGARQAKRYLTGLFSRLEQISTDRSLWRRIPNDYNVDGYYALYRSHIIYWREHADGTIRIVSILHERMDQPPRVSSEFGLKQ